MNPFAAVVLLAAPSPSTSLDLVMFETVKRPEAIVACLKTSLDIPGKTGPVQVEPFSQSKANRAWYVRFRLDGAAAAITVTPSPQGSYVVYPRQIGQTREPLAMSIEDCG